MFKEAYVLISSENGAEKYVLKEVRKKDGVVEAYQTFGNYDVIAKVRADSLDAVTEKIVGVDGIRRIKNIIRTCTLISCGGFKTDKDSRQKDV